MDEEYYTVLGLQRGASGDEIQTAYRKLARTYHPDLNPDDAKAKEKFQAVQRAYEVLSDPKTREMYDRYGRTFEGGGPAPGPGRGWRAQGPAGGGGVEFDFSQIFGGGGGASGGGGIDDILRQFTQGSSAAGRRGGRSSSKSVNGVDLRHDVTIPFNVAVNGGNHQLQLSRPDGATETISIKIPAGMEDGKRIRLRGQGGKAKPRGTPGDLIITVHVSAHPFFRRRGVDLHVDVPITLEEAAVGGKIDVPSPEGTITLTLPPGTSSGRRLRVRGKGVPSGTESRGDLYAEVQIVLPEDMDDETVQKLRSIGAKYRESPRKKLQW